MVQDTLAGGDGLLRDDLLHQRGECGGQLVRLRPAQHLREIALCIGVDQQNFFTLPRKTNAEAGGCGGLTHAALLICQGDCFQWDTSSNKKGALRPLF